MGLVQIEQSELDTLRKERDDSRAEAQTLKTEKEAATTAAEQAEAAKTAAESERDEATTKLTQAEEKAARAELKDKRWGALGTGFVAKLGDFTKQRLQEQASTMSEEDWDSRLKEIEETAEVKRDAAKDGDDNDNDDADANAARGGSPDFKPEELASLSGLGSGGGDGSKVPTAIERRSVVGQLSDAFAPSKPKND